MKQIKKYDDGSFLTYDKGRIDDWCVYYTNQKGYKIALKDTQCFEFLDKLSKTYGQDKIYSDYVKLYDQTKKEVEKEVLSYIEQMVKQYEKQEQVEVDKLFTILYMAMIAEEKKENTKLGKRIKRLGIHELLIEGKSVEESANFMKGKGWRELHQLCIKKGF